LGQGMLFTPVVLGIVFGHIVEYYVSFLAGLIIRDSNREHRKSANLFMSSLQKYRRFFFSRNFKSFLSFPDYEAIVFIFFPLIGMAREGLNVGFFLLILIVLYTILSTFIAIMTGGDKFP
ncbi:MAG: CDP-alcohol phosphatidyltransferase family protein, partial [Deltaproteobacteria bacterium]